MSTISPAVEDKQYLINKLTAQIERLGNKNERRLTKIVKINEKLNDKRESISNSEDSVNVLSKKVTEKNQRDKELFEKGLERRNNRLSRSEKRLADLTARVENYRISIQEWTNKKIESNRLRAEKRATAVKSVTRDSILEYIEKKEMYISILEKRNSQADALTIEKQNLITKLKEEIEVLKNKPKTKIKLVKQETEPVTETNCEPEVQEETELEPEPEIEDVIEENSEIAETQAIAEEEKIEEIISTIEQTKKQYFKPLQNLRNKANKK
ncbi:hypothetical protein D9V86_06300 [Bacteroidetes/Chlorobi group bacterium ChocPot_Mid]|nr:MAG: hypothetical protein D9V86_06300 [Bacteroidetes/Chlorobi group bacterium ChocPot_Mid]